MGPTLEFGGSERHMAVREPGLLPWEPSPGPESPSVLAGGETRATYPKRRSRVGLGPNPRMCGAMQPPGAARSQRRADVRMGVAPFVEYTDQAPTASSSLSYRLNSTLPST